MPFQAFRRTTGLTRYKDPPVLHQLAHEALAEWNKAPLSAVFHPCGVAYLDSTLFPSNTSVTDAASDLGKTFVDVGKYGDASLVRELPDAAAIKEACHLEGDKLETFRGWIDGSNGWAEAAGALKIVVDEAEKLGVVLIAIKIQRVVEEPRGRRNRSGCERWDETLRGQGRPRNWGVERLPVRQNPADRPEDTRSRTSTSRRPRRTRSVTSP